MECGDEMAMSVREIKQEVLEEDPDTLEEGGYQVIYVKEEIEDEDSRQDGGEAEMQMTTESSTESVGNPSLRNSNWDSGWQLPEEDEEEDVTEVGNVDAPFQYRIQDSNRQLSGDTEEQDDREATNPKLRISGCGKRSHQGTAGRDKGKVLKTSTKTGTRGKILNNDNSAIGVPRSGLKSNADKIRQNLYQCSDCSKIFLSKWERIAHVTNEHFRERPFKCPHCYKGFDKEDPLKDHMVTHSEQEFFQCPICTKKFSSNYMLKLHVKTHSREKRYQCSECHERFSFESGLLDHMKTHNSHISFPIVAKGIAGSSSQPENTRTHFEEKPFKCADCDKRFSQKWEHIEHTMDAHSREKPFKCHICYKGFDNGALLGMHMTCHPEQMSCECSDCNTVFLSENEFRLHMRIHSSKKPFKCADCDERFSQKSEHIDHMMDAHSVLLL